MSKQTALQWFISVLSHNDILDHKKVSSNKQLYNLYLRLKEQALEMEREQIIEANADGQYLNSVSLTKRMCLNNAECYYNETYGGKDEK